MRGAVITRCKQPLEVGPPGSNVGLGRREVRPGEMGGGFRKVEASRLELAGRAAS
jgi:hypothetical protein